MHRQTSTNNAMRLPVLPLLRKMPFKVMAGAGMGGGAFMKAQMVQPEGFHAELSKIYHKLCDIMTETRRIFHYPQPFFLIHDTL